MICIDLITVNKITKLGNSLHIHKAFSNLSIPLKSYVFMGGDELEPIHYELYFDNEKDELEFILEFL